MFKEKITFCLVQAAIHPQEIDANFIRYQQLLETIDNEVDIIVFPEMFACGFSDYMPLVAKEKRDASLLFLQTISQQYKADVVASLPIWENGKIFNRLCWIRGKETVNQYDKRHLFLGSEKEFCSQGTVRTVINYGQWRLMPLICYDVRFPIWCRNQYKNESFLYDCLLFVANFPVARAKTLRTLLSARAIENQAYTISVNRVGKDGYGVEYSGNTVIINPIGEIVAEMPSHEEGALMATIEYDVLEKVRKQLPYYRDWDDLEEVNGMGYKTNYPKRKL